jgi:hypothetical protein
MAAYRIDVLDPAVTPRRIEVLSRRLPPWARQPGDTWSAEAELLALLIDHVAYLSWITVKAHGSKNAPKPKPIPRPAAVRREPDRSAAAATAPQAASRGGGGWAATARQLAAIPGVVIRDG